MFITLCLLGMHEQNCCGRFFSGDDKEDEYRKDHSWLFNHCIRGKKHGQPADRVPESVHTLSHKSTSPKSMTMPDFSNGSDKARADVFFVHPTLVLTCDDKSITNEESRKADDASKEYALAQASAFNGTCRIFAPFYNSAIAGHEDDEDAMKVAYEDVATAFSVYLKEWNGSRPFFIAGHGQGATHCARLMKNFLDSDSEGVHNILPRFLGAYLCGTPVYPSQLPAQLPLAKEFGQVGTICAWTTTEAPETATEEPVCTNPCRVSTEHKGALSIPAISGRRTFLYAFFFQFKQNVTTFQLSN